MHLLHQLAARQAGFGCRRFAGAPPSFSYLPESSLESLQVNNYYRFLDSDQTGHAPPLCMTIAGDRIALANDIGDVALISKADFTERYIFNAHRSAIFDLKWRGLNQNEPGSIGASARHFLTASGDRSIVLWDAERPNVPLLPFYNAHLGSIKTIAFHDQNMFASGGRDGSIKFWDLRTGIAVKHGPQFEITDPHIHSLPSIKSPRTVGLRRASRAKRSPIATAVASKNYLPSNVVTSVNFEPTFNYHLYSTGISDSSIKVWDIRRCQRMYEGSHTPRPVKVYSIKQCYSGVSTLSSNGHGFSSLTFQHSPKYGNILLASATDSKVYAFVGDTPHPIMLFSGRYGNNFTRVSPLGDNYVLGGASNGRAVIWRADLSFPSASTSPSDRLVIENRLPTYEFQFSDNEDICLASFDTSSASLYTTSENQLIYKWSFYPNPQLNIDQLRMAIGGDVPKVVPFKADGLDARTITLKRPASWSRPVTFPNRLQTSDAQPSAASSLTKDTSSEPKAPLGLITSWIHNIRPASGTQSEPSTKRLKTAHCGAAVSQSVTAKRTPKRALRRNLFANNRKISEYFFTP